MHRKSSHEQMKLPNNEQGKHLRNIYLKEFIFFTQKGFPQIKMKTCWKTVWKEENRKAVCVGDKGTPPPQVAQVSGWRWCGPVLNTARWVCPLSQIKTLRDSVNQTNVPGEYTKDKFIYAP